MPMTMTVTLHVTSKVATSVTSRITMPVKPPPAGRSGLAGRCYWPGSVWVGTESGCVARCQICPNCSLWRKT